MCTATTEFGLIAIRFAQALVDGDYELAHSLLSPSLRRQWTPASLAAEVDAMHTYAPGPATSISFLEPDGTLVDWPSKQPDDLGWAYVGIDGEDFMEGVAVVVAKDGIREIDWGRP